MGCFIGWWISLFWISRCLKFVPLICGLGEPKVILISLAAAATEGYELEAADKLALSKRCKNAGSTAASSQWYPDLSGYFSSKTELKR